MPANRGPNLPRVLTDELPTRSTERAQCPRGCGELRFSTDQLGFTVERCDVCGHRLKIVASRQGRAPRVAPEILTDGRPAPRGALTAHLLALLPSSPDDAILLRDLVAMSGGLAPNRVTGMLTHLKRRGKVGVVPGVRVTPSGRCTVNKYYRRAA